MTVTYTLECSRSRFGTFVRLLFRWRGSVYKLLYKDLAIFLLLYFSISFVYRFLLNPQQCHVFERVVEFCLAGVDLIPLTFVLGFFVSLVVDRWWNNFLAIAWPDRMAIKIACYVSGSDERGRIIRRTLVRYMNLTLAIALRDLSSAAKKRFPTWEHLVIAGLMTEKELNQYLQIKDTYPLIYVFFVPIMWATNLLAKARKEGRIKSDYDLRTLHKELLAFRGKIGDLTCYDWITLPLVYTQVITIAVYGFFVLCLIARQYVRVSVPDAGTIDLIFPPFTMLQFIFFMGWLKVAQVLMNPFGEDDDDFEINYLLERHIKTAYLIVDDCHDVTPQLTRDIHWKEEIAGVPHTLASVNLKNNPPVGSATNYHVPQRLQSIVETEEKPDSVKRQWSTDDIIDILAKR